jgi:hypothetical protein
MKWKPNKTQRRAFALKMQDDEFRSSYHERKEKRQEKKRSGSKFDYTTAGGMYTPTKTQYDSAMELMLNNPTIEQKTASNSVIMGYTCNEKIHHDNIHIINEYIRSKSR